MNKRRINIYLLALFVTYVVGGLTVKYDLPPIQLIKELRGSNTPSQPVAPSDFDKEFVSSISSFDRLRYPAMQDKHELNRKINEMSVEINNFDSAYQGIEILTHSIEENKLVLAYRYQSLIDTAFAYFKPGKNRDSNIGINIIPGSGSNQSSAMYFQNAIDSNYQSNIDDIAVNYGDCFILVKPNEDFLAIHNGKKKVPNSLYINHLLNHGSSYSAYYIIQGLALSKYLKSKYEEFFVFGLSQGGLAALINSTQSAPDAAIIASGFSVFLNTPSASNHDQIIIPGYGELYNPNNLKSMINKIETQFLFTWGLKEKGNYGREARERLTEKFFKELGNIQTSFHPAGHIYHTPTIINFLESYQSRNRKRNQNVTHLDFERRQRVKSAAAWSPSSTSAAIHAGHV